MCLSSVSYLCDVSFRALHSPKTHRDASLEILDLRKRQREGERENKLNAEGQMPLMNKQNVTRNVTDTMKEESTVIILRHTAHTDIVQVPMEYPIRIDMEAALECHRSAAS